MGGALIRVAASAESGAARAPDRAREAVVAVHGLWMIGGVMAILRGGSVARLHTSRPFGYASIARGSTRMPRSSPNLSQRVPGDTVHLLGHSLGCVVIRALLERHVARSARADRVPRDRRSRAA